jgi:hypothetical protein
MAYQVLGTNSRAWFGATQRLISAAISMVFLALATAVSQGQTPTTAPRPTNPTVPNPNVPGKLPTPNPNLAFRLDHFLCYLVQPTQFPPRPDLSLTDQFNLQPRPFVLAEREWLCNPVSKNGEPVHNPRGHLVGYVMRKPATPPLNIPVSVVNQFGAQRFVVVQQDILFVPTGKLIAGQPTTAVPPPPPIPEGLDHYACYSVKPEGATPHPGVVLSDQFGKLQGEVVEPAFLCNPAVKLIDKKPTNKIINARDHLMCYVVSIGGFQPRKVQIHNQFETMAIEAVRPEVLCVPSTKELLKQ